jgi:Holliday junction resolvasome RuvABC endonuclease subunit
MITIGIDSSTTNCGVAIFENGTLLKTINYPFPGNYDLPKLEKITKTFIKLFSEQRPDMIILETPAPVRNSRTLTALNQVAGAIWGVAVSKGIFIDTMHNKTAKKVMGTKSKEDAVRKVEEVFGISVLTDHEADAVLVVEAYKLLYK